MLTWIGFIITSLSLFGAYIVFGGNLGVITEGLPNALVLIGGFTLGTCLMRNGLGFTGEVFGDLFSFKPSTAPNRDERRAVYGNRLAAVSAVSTTLLNAGVLSFIFGVIKTFTHITSPPAELGAMVGDALVSLVFALFMTQAVIDPLGGRLARRYDEDLAKIG